MPSSSKKQKTAANMAHAIKKGYIKPKAGTASAEMAKGMTDTQISHFRKEGANEEEVCDTCNGQGWYMDGPTDDPQQRQCDACQGTGKKLNEDSQELNIYTIRNAIEILARYIVKNGNPNKDPDPAMEQVFGLLDKRIDELRAEQKKMGKLKQRQGIKEIIRNIVQEVITEGEEEKLGSSVYDREDRWNRERNPNAGRVPFPPFREADRVDIAKMSPEDQKKAINCLAVFYYAKRMNISANKIEQFAMELEALNREYGTDVGNTSRK